jgi:beta-lactamase class A
MNDRFLRNLSSRQLIFFISLLVCIHLVGIILGYYFRDVISAQKDFDSRPYAIRSDGYKYINPLLDCENALDSDENKALDPFENKVRELLVQYAEVNAITALAVYFRDLNNGPWFSFDPDEKFSPASLLKVPFLMAILKQAEHDPTLLANKLLYNGNSDFNSIQNIKPYKKLKKGEFYTVEQLLHQMIIHSDNNASALLEDFFGVDILKEVHKMAGMPEISIGGVSVVEYARFFRLLYNASYLNREMSEKALAIAAQVSAADGLIAAVPPDIKVAHKFGEQISIIDGVDELIQLHECGIIYYPQHPYILCVMTKGNSFETLDDAIMQISHVVYDGVNAQHLP